MFFFLSCSNVFHGIIVDVQCICIVQINTFNYTFCWITFCSGLASLPSRYNIVESTLKIGCYVEQPKFNVVSTLQFLRWICNVESTLILRSGNNVENSNVVSTLNIQPSQFKGEELFKRGVFETLGLGPFKVENSLFQVLGSNTAYHVTLLISTLTLTGTSFLLVTTMYALNC
jgi:hypothetical protein